MAVEQSVAQLLKLITTRANFKRPLEVRVYEGSLRAHLPPHGVKVKDWNELLEQDLVTFIEGTRPGYGTLDLSAKGVAILTAWNAKNQGRLVYERAGTDEFYVFLNDQQIGTWTRLGDPSVRGYRRVGYKEPVWEYIGDDDEDVSQQLRTLKSPQFEGKTLPAIAKKWLADQVKNLV